MIVGTAGHIDHGKTALVRALTGIDTDRLPEERRRGITIELGFAALPLEGGVQAAMVDVPGHEAFVRTMLAGATGVDLGLLVIAADEGIMPQTREHLSIMQLLGVRDLVVALSKCDLVEEEWVELVREDVAALLAGTPFPGAPIVPTSASTGAGVGELRAELGRRLRALPARSVHDLFRMPIDRVFTVSGTGTVVTGTIWSGTVGAQTSLRLFPPDQPVRVRGVQSHGAQQATLDPGSRAAVALAGVELSTVSRGGWLVEEGAWEAARVIRADVALLDSAPRAVRAREWVRLHLGTTDVGARVVAPGGALVAGETRGVRLVLDEPLVSRAGDRFVLRLPSPAATIGGGIVTDPMPRQRRVRPWPAGLTADDRLARLLDEAGEVGVEFRTLPVRVGVPPGECERLVAALHDAMREGGRLFRGAVVRALLARVVAVVEQSHRSHPLDAWVALSAIRSAVSPGGENLALPLALALGVREGVLEQGGGGVRRMAWAPTMSDELAREREALFERLLGSGTEPPSVAELRSERSGNDPIPLLRNLEEAGRVVQVEPDRFYASEVVRGLVSRLEDRMERGREYGPAELRAVLGTSRKFLIPFLEYCDRQRITERRPGGRVFSRQDRRDGVA